MAIVRRKQKNDFMINNLKVCICKYIYMKLQIESLFKKFYVNDIFLPDVASSGTWGRIDELNSARVATFIDYCDFHLKIQ